jgi:hypothetical protein
MSTLQSLLTTFCKKYHLAEPKEDGDKNYHIDFSSQISFYLKQLNTGFYAQSYLCPCPKENKEEIYMNLMSANILHQKTGKGVIGMDFKGNFLLLSVAIPYAVNEREFHEEIEEFVNYVIFWRKEIRKLIQESKKST